jgi:DNA-binding response OmpR family regulator/HPt (histidine-containing phosphotransfer) domain-containing protein
MKVLFIEDDQPTRELLSALLSEHRYAVDPIADGAVGLELAIRWNYDLILLDVLMPTLNGIEVCRRLRAQGCQTPILMLTTKDSNEDVIAGLDAGADDYVAKSCAPSQLLARVRALLRRGDASSAPVLSWGLLCLDPASARVAYSRQEIALRPKEYSLLELFLRHPQRILSRSAIIDHLWSMEEPPVEASVTNLIKDLRQRLKSSGMSDDLIETVYGLGYRLKTVPADKKFNITIGQAINQDNHDDVREKCGRIAIQQISERFETSLKHRIALLEAAEQSLQAGHSSLKQGEVIRAEAHKLAGGLGTFGYVKASRIARDIERLAETQVSQETRLTDRLAHLLEDLKQELAKPSAHRQAAGPSLVGAPRL